MNWLNPLDPQVCQFFKDLCQEVLANYNVAGIQFDDHFIWPVEMGYDPQTISTFQAETARTLPDDFKNASWKQWRANKLIEFIGELRTAIRGIHTASLLSISPNPSGYALENQLQDWLSWEKNGLIDEVVVQVYRRALSAFNNEINKPEFKSLPGRVSISIGILAGLAYKPIAITFIEQQLTAARVRKLGVSFFFYESLFSMPTKVELQGTSPEQAQRNRKGEVANLFAVPEIRP